MDESMHHQEQEASGQEHEQGRSYDGNGESSNHGNSNNHPQPPPPFDPQAIAAQLPANFPRGDAAAMDAVMQLAQAASQQQHFNFGQHVGSNSEDSSQMEAKSKRRRSSQSRGRGGSTSTGTKSQKRDGEQVGTSDGQDQDQSQDQGQNQNQTPWSPDYEQLLRRHLNQAEEEGMRDQTQQGDAGGAHGEHDGHEAAVAAAAAASAAADAGAGTSLDETSAQALARNGRALSNTKRAAQNRAAQRAFRERRDKYVKEVEAKAELLEKALTSERHYRSQYEDALKTIEGLRSDNQSLRLAINALGGNVPAAQSAPESAPEQPQSREEGEEQRWEQVDPTLERQAGHGNDTAPSKEQRQTNEDGQLDGLRAVAAAAAAAVVSEGNKDDQQTQENGQ